jgi:fructokinase
MTRARLEAGMYNPKVTVIGEALIDLVPGHAPLAYSATPGGSPYNVAIGLARLGQDTTLMARLADNAFGHILRDRALGEGIDLDASPHASEPTTLAVVSVDGTGTPAYDFYFDGTADWQWTAEETRHIPDRTAVLHFGSIASWTSPGAARVIELGRRMRDRGDVLVSYDPNIRPSLLGDRDHAQRMVERGLRVAHVAKASAEDIAWLYPGQSPEDVARHWLQLGVTVAVITDGASGADLFTAPGPPLHRPVREVKVVDTVGAGDSFTAGLLASLMRRQWHIPARLAERTPEELSAVLDDAIVVSAITCERAGANPPRLTELTDTGWGRG